VAPRLEHPRPAARTRRPPTTTGARPRRPSLPTPARPTRPELARNPAPVASPLRDRGIGLLAAFTVAVLLIVVLAVVVGAIDRWWILIPVMAVDFAVTAAVLVMVARLLDDGRNG